MSNQLIHDIVKRHLHPADSYIYGFANLTGLLPSRFDGYSFGISIARKLDDNIIDGIIDAPTPKYLHHYEEINHLTLAHAEIRHLSQDGCYESRSWLDRENRPVHLREIWRTDQADKHSSEY